MFSQPIIPFPPGSTSHLQAYLSPTYILIPVQSFFPFSPDSESWPEIQTLPPWMLIDLLCSSHILFLIHPCFWFLPYPFFEPISLRKYPLISWTYLLTWLPLLSLVQKQLDRYMDNCALPKWSILLRVLKLLWWLHVIFLIACLVHLFV